MNLYVRRTLPIVVILVITAALIKFIEPEASDLQDKEVSRTIPVVEVVPIHPATQSILIESNGLIEPDVEMIISPEIAGKIIEVSESFESGRLVKQGTLLARIDPLPHQIKLQEAEASLLKAEAGLIQEQAEHDIAALNWKDVKIKPSPLALREPQIKKAKAAVKIAQAKLQQAQRDVSRLEIRAPFDGLIEKRRIKLGQHVSATTELGSVFGTEYARIRLPIRPQHLHLLASEHSQVLLQTTEGDALQATLSYAEKLMDKATRMYYVVAKIKDPYRLKASNSAATQLPFSTLVDAKIVGKQWPNLVKIPMTSLYKDQVLTVDTAHRLHQQPVEILYRTQQDVFFQFAGHEGEQFVYTPLESPQVGQVYAVQLQDQAQSATLKSLPKH
jgi:RND family efflux transporter MFP subunit